MGGDHKGTQVSSDSDPLYIRALEEIESLLARAAACEGIREPTAMSLATVDEAGMPNVRIVLLKGIDPRGLVFYTNLESTKGVELAANPVVALCFYWGPLLRQVRVRGVVQSVSEAEADAYFKSRSRESQLGAWASLQSRGLDDMSTLEQRFEQYAKKFEGVDVPRPSHWSGLRVVPNRIEVWESRAHRLHTRRCVFLEGGVWRSENLYP